jgi:phosphoglycerate dehydrogenase-like enzyme
VLPSRSPLYRLPNVLLTPHIAGSLGTETQRLADYVVDEIERYARGSAEAPRPLRRTRAIGVAARKAPAR